MKKFICFLFFFFYAVFLSDTQAGTILVGPDIKYGSYRDGTQGFLRQTVNEHDKKFDGAIDTEGIFSYLFDIGEGGEPVTGIMAGLMLGYKSDDKNWEFSFAPFFSSWMKYNFEDDNLVYDLDGNTDFFHGDDQYPLILKDKEKITRLESDLMINYFFTEWFKMFFEYQYQYLKAEGTSTAEARDRSGTVIASSEIDTSLNTNTHFPVLGIGFTLSFLDRFSLGFNIGAGMCMGSGQYKVGETKKHIKIKPLVGGKTDLTFSARIGDSTTVQAGLIFQLKSYKMTNTPDVDIDYNTVKYKTDNNSDSFIGVNLSATQAFEI